MPSEESEHAQTESTYTSRISQATLILSFLTFSWLAMQAVHELGHITAALATDAEIIKVYLHPFIISSTEIGENPHPLILVWAGPVFGALLPFLAFLVAKTFRTPGLYLIRFFAGFCLVVNGIYIAFGPSTGGADTAIMMEHGTPRWVMVLFGLATAPLGLYLWHRQGPHFGLGKARGHVERRAAVVSLCLCIGLIVVELAANLR
jgi:hypothetical protein